MALDPSHAVAQLVRVVSDDPDLASRFAAGATEQELKSFSEALALAIPKGLLKFLSHFNGNTEARWDDNTLVCDSCFAIL